MFSKIVTVCMILKITTLTDGRSTHLKATMPPSCDKNYCFTQNDDYPQDLIDRLIEKEKLIETVEDLGRREGDVIINNDCQARTYFDPIYTIKDYNDTVRYVVQTSDSATRSFRQTLRMEECVNPGLITKSTMNLDLESPLLKFYEFHCVQTDIDYSFLVLSLDGQKIEVAKAKGGIPVCCKCIVKEK